MPTTHEFMLAKSAQQRFRIHLRVKHYSDDEMVQLVRQRAKRLGWSVDEQAVAAIGFRSRGVPRLAVRLLEAAKRVASSEATEEITQPSTFVHAAWHGRFLSARDATPFGPRGAS